MGGDDKEPILPDGIAPTLERADTRAAAHPSTYRPPTLPATGWKDMWREDKVPLARGSKTKTNRHPGHPYEGYTYNWDINTMVRRCSMTKYAKGMSTTFPNAGGWAGRYEPKVRFDRCWIKHDNSGSTSIELIGTEPQAAEATDPGKGCRSLEEAGRVFTEGATAIATCAFSRCDMEESSNFQASFKTPKTRSSQSSDDGATKAGEFPAWGPDSLNIKGNADLPGGTEPKVFLSDHFGLLATVEYESSRRDSEYSSRMGSYKSVDYDDIHRRMDNGAPILQHDNFDRDQHDNFDSVDLAPDDLDTRVWYHVIPGGTKHGPVSRREMWVIITNTHNAQMGMRMEVSKDGRASYDTTAEDYKNAAAALMTKTQVSWDGETWTTSGEAFPEVHNPEWQKDYVKNLYD